MMKMLCALILSLALCQSANAQPKPLPPPPPPPADGATPAGYTLAWNDEFDDLSLGGPGTGARWVHYFTGWNVRRLSGNSDDAFKASDEESWNGGTPVGQSLR